MAILTDGSKLRDIIPHTKKIRVVGITGKKSACAITNSVEIGTIITADIGYSYYNYDNSISLHWKLSNENYIKLSKNNSYVINHKDKSLCCYDSRVFKRLDNVFIFEEIKDE